MAFLPGKLEGGSLSKKASPVLGKAFPKDFSADGQRRQDWDFRLGGMKRRSARAPPPRRDPGGKSVIRWEKILR
jgi:hypothetical protein